MAPPRSLALAAPLTAQAEDEGALVSLASGGGLESAEEEGRARAESLQGSRPGTSPDGGYRRQALAASHIQKRTSQPPGA